MHEAILDVLEIANAKPEAVRAKLMTALDDQAIPADDLASLVARLKRLSSDVARVEGANAGQTVGVRESFDAIVSRGFDSSTRGDRR